MSTWTYEDFSKELLALLETNFEGEIITTKDRRLHLVPYAMASLSVGVDLNAFRVYDNSGWQNPNAVLTNIEKMVEYHVMKYVWNKQSAP